MLTRESSWSQCSFKMSVVEPIKRFAQNTELLHVLGLVQYGRKLVPQQEIDKYDMKREQIDLQGAEL